MEMLSPENEMLLAATDGALRKLRRVEYDALVTQGFFADEHVELLFGLVIPMTPIDPAHAESVDRIADRLRQALVGRARVRLQMPLAALDDSEPEPDIMVIADGTYWDNHPSRAALVVEVANSSLRRDRAKRALYARAEVAEYWIVNLGEGYVEVHRQPHEGRWGSITRHARGETIHVSEFPDATLEVSEILPPA